MPSGGRHGSREVEAARAPLGLGQVARGQQDHRESDRDVDEQPPAPGEPVGQHAAEHEADAAAAARNGAVIGDRARARLPLAEGRRQQRERRGRRDRGADALHRARAEQPGGRRRQPAGERRGGEQADPDRRACGGGRGCRRRGRRAAGGRRTSACTRSAPTTGPWGEVQRAVDLRQRGDDDRDVEDDHQVAGEDDRQHRGRIRRCAGSRPVDLRMEACLTSVRVTGEAPFGGRW